MVQVMFKIRNTKTGLFSTGGTSPNWTKKGKVWNSRGNAILSLLGYWNGNRIPISDLEVVEFATIEAMTLPAEELLRESSERKSKRVAESRERTKRWQRARDEAAFEELRVKLGKP